MSYPVFLVEYIGMPRNHHAIYVQTAANNKGEQSGILIHVTGSVQTGMTFENRPVNKAPEESSSFVSKSPVGWVAASNLRALENICRSNPPPEKQFNGHKRINPKKPLRRCQEWTAETLRSLEAQGVLKRDGGSSASGSNAAAQQARSSQSRSRSNSPADGQTSQDGYWTWSQKYQNWYHSSRDGHVLWANQSSASQGKRRA